MAKKKKKKKVQGLGSFWSRILASRLVLICLVCAVLAGGIFYGLWYFFHNSRFFAVKEILVNKEGNYSFWEGESKLKELYTGRNMFNIDLKEIELVIRERSPQLKTVVIRRIMPNRLEVDIISRKPAAFINSAGGLIIDKEGVVLARGKNKGDLVEIKGIRFFFKTPPRGERIDNAMLDKALMLSEGLREKGLLSGKYRTRYIDISDKNNIQLDILGVKVKMGNNDFSDRINKLRNILKDPDVNIKGINYIDLRFDDIVISPK